MMNYQIKTFGSKNVVEPTPTSSISEKFKSLEQQKNNVATQNTHGNTAKPLFKPSVLTIISEQDDKRISTLLINMGFTDFVLATHEKTRILFLCDDMNVDDHSFVSDYGTDINSDESLSTLTAITQSSSIVGIRSSLASIMEKISLVDIDALRGNRSFFSIFSKKVSTKDDFFALDKEIMNEVRMCMKHLEKLKQLFPSFNNVDEETEKQFRKLTVYIIAGQLRIDLEKSTMSNTTQTDFFAAQTMNDHKESVSRFERRVQNLALIRQTMLLRMSQLRLELKNILALVDQTTEIISVVIPTWKQQVLTVFSSNTALANDFYDVLEKTQKSMQEKLQNAKGA